MLNKKRRMMKKSSLVVVSLSFLFLFISIVSAASDVSVFQGQYYIGEELQLGTFEFNFDIYDNETGGNLTYSDTQNLSTGFWGQWRAELSGISSASNDTTKDYFMEIIIDGNVQGSRKRLTHFNYLRKDVDDSTTGDLTISNILNFLSGGYIQELADRFIFNKSLEVTGDINATGEIYSNNTKVCLEDGTNCQSVSSSKWSENGSMIYYNDGNVGIGTTSPDYALDVNGNIRVKETLHFTDTRTISAENYLSLNGNGDHMTVPDDATLDITNNVTWSAWVRWGVAPGTVPSWATIMDKSDSSWASDIRLQHSANNEKFEWSILEGQYILSITEPQSDILYHVVGTYDGSTMKLFVDGSEEASKSVSGNIEDNSNSLHIGCEAASQSREFTGDITDIRIYNTALTPTQIATLYGNGRDSTGETLDSGGNLVSRWDFSELDYTDNEGSNDGTPNGDATISSDNATTEEDSVSIEYSAQNNEIGFGANLEVGGNIKASGDITSNNKLVCLEDGTNCIAVANGTDGIDGVNGSIGPQGPQGPAGVNGTDGDTWFSLISGWLSYVGNIFIDGNINATGSIYSDNKLVCLEDGTNCVSVEKEWNVSGSYLYPRDLNKFVGIGINTPRYGLDINGEIGLDGYEILDINDDYITLGDLDGGGSKGIKFFTDYGNEVIINNGGGINASGSIYSNNTKVCLEDGTNCQSVDPSKWSENGSMIYYNDGNVGIGTDSPTKKLEVADGGLLIVPDKSLSYDSPFRIETVRNGYSDSAFSVSTSSKGGSIGLYEYNSRRIHLSGYGDSYFNNNYNLGIGASSPSEKLEVVGNIKASGNITSNGSQVCTAGNGLCGGGSTTQYVSFILTVNANLRKNTIYLPLGTNSEASLNAERAAWIIDRDLTITGILWNIGLNSRTASSYVTLEKSTTDKSSFSQTSLSVDLQGTSMGMNDSFSVSFDQGDLAVLKYHTNNAGTGVFQDPSVTLVGYYED